RIRVEHEDNANTMGRIAGLNMAGHATAYDHLPFFYSDLFELGYEAVGDLDARLEAVADWKEPFREGVVYFLKGGRVRGILLWNTWGQVDHARQLIAEPGPFRPSDLKGRLPAEFLQPTPTRSCVMDETVEPGVVVVRGSAARCAQEITVGGHRLLADGPAGCGGAGAGAG